MVSGWESEDPGFTPWWIQATFDPGCQKKYSQPYNVPLMIDFARHTLKIKKDEKIKLKSGYKIRVEPWPSQYI